MLIIYYVDANLTPFSPGVLLIHILIYCWVALTADLTVMPTATLCVNANVDYCERPPNNLNPSRSHKEYRKNSNSYCYKTESIIYT